VYLIGILDFVFDEDVDDTRYFYEVKLLDTIAHSVFYDNLTFLYLQTPKFDKLEDEIETQFDKWMYVFKHLHHLTSRPVKLQGRIFERLFEAAAIARLDPAEFGAYEASVKALVELRNAMDTAKDEGREAGKLEKAREVAARLKAKGIPIDVIAESTGISREEIEKLRTT
jgi:predicted transposase/invertase (TIGR01784 family)